MVMFLFLSFIWAWVATKEVRAISKDDPIRATLWSAGNAALTFSLTYVIAATLSFTLFFPYVLGISLATLLAMRKAR